MTSKYIPCALVLAYAVGCFAQVYTSQTQSTKVAVSTVEEPPANNDFITQTVYGFLDFTTTIGNTVMVFSPQSAPPDGDKGKMAITSPAIQTKPDVQKKHPDIQPSKTYKSEADSETKKPQKGGKIVVNSVVEQNVVNQSEQNVVHGNDNNVKTHVNVVTKSPVMSTVIQVNSKYETPVLGNNLAEPEYDFLSKQPSEIVDETYKIINLKPSTKISPKPRPTPRRDKENPTGLVTKLGGTIVKDGLTTVHETSVIGTYINGKYAQVLQSSSRILTPAAPAVPEGKVRPTNAQRILKTIGPQQGKLKPHLEPTPTVQQEESSLPLEVLFSAPSGPSVRTTRRHTGGIQSRPKFRNKIAEDLENNEPQAQQRSLGKARPTTARPSYKNRIQQTTTTEPAVTRRRNGFRPNNPVPIAKPGKPKNEPLASAGPLPKVKLPRTPGRWSYKTTPKPRIAIRKQVVADEDDRTLAPETSAPEVGAEEKTPMPMAQRKIQEGSLDDESKEASEVAETVAQEHEQDQQRELQQDQPQESLQQPQQHVLPVETLNVEISTPADFNDVYFEIATIKSPYTFQVGTMRNTRYVTVTSTIKKSFATAEPTSSIAPTEPLTENILANTGAAYETTLPIDSSIATLPAVSLEAGQATPPLETITETFSTTQTLLKTHLLPVISGGNTTRLTLVQTYNIARVVTATKTLPPMEIYQFIPSKTLNEFNSKLDEAGSELHLELDFGDDDRDDDDIPKRVMIPGNEGISDLDVFRSVTPSKAKIDSVQPSLMAKEPQLSPEQAQQLALYKYFGQPQPQVITTSRPVVVLETVYESHVIPVLSGGNTVYSTLSRPVATVPRTSYEYGTSTISPILPPPVPQPQVPLFPQQQPQFTVTSAPIVTQTLATVSDSRVLKLTFGAKTAYTTLFSTKVIPTELTTYVTSTVPLQPTVQPFPGYFPQPVAYPPFPYVG
ncbi:uncharacterized protein LOC105703457 [Orussus abietinus]|uniref:uncharacterized protein LOC105703457 n=1 Tax=Orussus abietinus TaxID=222816 RepID=UPI000626D105|nr:uncharacterized protein LOC105703457 [Orussus abietinus]